jgi:beta-lactamase class A
MKLFPASLFAAVLAILAGVTIACAAALTLPLKVPNRDWRPLLGWQDRSLEARLEAVVRQHPVWQSLVKEGRMAVGLVDLIDPIKPRFARINGDTMMYAASLPKIAVLLAAFQGFEDDTLKDTPELQAGMVEMIRRSDNAAASRVIAQVGLKKIEAVILNPRYRFYDHTNGGLWVGTDYGPHQEHNPEPLKNLEHAATVTQVCRFYYLLAGGRLVNPGRSRQMLKIMAFPDLDDKFIQGLKGTVPLSQVYRKSGEYKTWHSDSMLVWAGGWRRYILAAMVADARGEMILRELVPAVEQILKPRTASRSGSHR